MNLSAAAQTVRCASRLGMAAAGLSNPQRYPEWHAYFRKHQPATLIAWGKDNRSFWQKGLALQTEPEECRVLLVRYGPVHLEEDGDFIASHAWEVMTSKVQTAVRFDNTKPSCGESLE